uniref:Uncharacterized protein n=1 Tax=Eutreptiella gymnastica TaxID=73025 RepID=A0A7S4CAU0_9EUGL|mmetsp:Transcript_81701/g.136732  ORF Transcript_81701/g.136732 Transcript_81701/m.136732 type:complete len:105 (+) Transcript_81701:392-706(+)
MLALRALLSLKSAVRTFETVSPGNSPIFLVHKNGPTGIETALRMVSLVGGSHYPMCIFNSSRVAHTDMGFPRVPQGEGLDEGMVTFGAAAQRVHVMLARLGGKN